MACAPLFASTSPSGQLDTTFGPSGKPQFNVATVTVPSFSRAVVSLPGGAVIVGGGSNSSGLYKDYVIQKLDASGNFDGSFGTDAGFTHTDMGFDDQINAMAVNSTGTRICGGGIAGPSPGASSAFGVACYTANGLLDTSFSGDGLDLSTTNGFTVTRIEGMTFDRDDRLIVVGWSNSPSTRDWMIKRYNTDGTPDTTFGPNHDGWVVIDWGGFDRCFDVAILNGATHAQDKIVVVGSSQNSAGAIAILSSVDGSFDTSTGLAPTGKFTGTPAPSNYTQFRGVGIEQSTATKYVVVTGQGGNGGFYVVRYALATGAMNSSGNFATTNNDVGFRIKIGANDRVYASGTSSSGGDFRVAKMKADLSQDSNSPEFDYAVTTDFGGSDFAQDLVVINSGDPVNERVTAVGGGSGGLNSMTVARYLPNGNLDTSFSGDGKYEAQLTGGSADESVAFAVQADGKAVVAGTTFNSNGDYDLAVTRINTDGTRDTSGWASGTGGWDTRGFSAGSAEQMNPGGVAIDSNGKAVVVGTSNGYFALRYNTNGTLDTNFNTTGIVLGNWGTNSEGKVVAIDASNNIIVGGDISLNGDFKFSRLAANNGALDTTFGASGVATVDIAATKSDVLKAIAIDPSGRIVAGGECVSPAGFFKMCLARLNSNGTLDATFNGTGKVFLTSVGASADSFDIRSLQLLPNLDTASATDYKIVVAGQYVQSSPSQAMWFAARFNLDGSLDTSFNTTGYKTFAAGTSQYIGSANSVALQYDEKLVLVGESSAPDPLNAGFYLARVITVARLNWDGSLDTTYGTNGFTYTSYSSDPSEAHQVYIYPQSNASLKGRALLTPFIIASDFAMNRYREDPAPISGASAPVLDPVSDTGRSNSDKITKDTTPTFTGTCSQGETVYLLVNGANTLPRTRQICGAAGTYALTPTLSGVPRTTYSITTQTQTGIGDSAVSAALSVTVDAEINPAVVINNPTAGSNQLPNVSVDGTSEAVANVVVTTNHPKGGGCVAGVLANGNVDGSGSGSWTCSNTGFKQGPHTISVVQTDLAGNVASAVTRSFSVKVSTTTAITSSVNPSKYGQPVTFTATVTPGPNADVALTGTTIRFLIDGSQVSAPALDVNGQATFTPSGLGLSVGTHTVQAVYDENANWLGSSGSVTPNQVVQKADTTTAVTSGTNPTVFGQSVTFTATVASVSPGAGTPTGTVTFLDGGSSIGSGTLNGSGIATFSTTGLAVGGHTITATYGSDTNYNGSSGSMSGNPQVVNKANTATALISSKNPSLLNQSVTFTATITAVSPGAGTPSGTVTFLDGGSSIGTGTLSGGVATFTTTTLTVGNHTITTTYPGDGNFNGSSGSMTGNPQVVNKLPTTTTLTSSQNPAKFGQGVTFTATVAATPPGTGTPTGTVTFLDGGSSIGTGTLDASGVATFSTSTLSVGNHTITANYGADPTFATSTGSLTGNPQVIVKADTSTALTSISNPSVFGQSVTFTATLSATAPGAGTPSGTVTFLDGGSTIGSGTLTAGVATLTSTTLSVGNHTITTTYAGDTNFNGSPGSLTGNPQVVSKDATTTQLTSSQNPSLPAQAVTFTATVTANAPGAGTPTGTVTFLDGGSSIGTGTLTGGIATLTTSSLTPGNHTITTTYPGDGNFTGSGGSLTGNPQLVSKFTTATTITAVTPPGPITLGSSTDVSASVAVVPPGSGTPTGTITVTSTDTNTNATDTCMFTLPATKCTLTPTTIGSKAITASYSGDSTSLASTSSPTAFSVTPATRRITASASANGLISPATQYVADGATANFSVVPRRGFVANMSTTCPEGLGTLSNNLYTTLPVSADCTVTADFVNAAASLSLTLTDNRGYARYGNLSNFVVSIGNSSGNQVTGLSISGAETSTGSNFDTAGGHWVCFGSAAQCVASGTGAFNDTNVSIPANGSVSWLVTLPVRMNAPDLSASYTVTVTSAGTPVTQTDTDWLVVYRDGFDVPYGDGTQIVPLAPSGWDGSTTLRVRTPNTANAMIETLLSANAPDGGFRIERLNGADQAWLRVVTSAAAGERASAWTHIAPDAVLALSVAGAGDSRTLVVLGAESEIDWPIGAANSWQVQATVPE